MNLINSVLKFSGAANLEKVANQFCVDRIHRKKAKFHFEKLKGVWEKIFMFV